MSSKPKRKVKKALSSKYRPITKSKRKTRVPNLFVQREPDCKQAEYLIGPVELDILDHPQTGARIVLLGDLHVNQKQCPSNSRCTVSIWLYLEDLFKQYGGSEFIDIFLEMQFAEQARGPIISALQKSEEFGKHLIEGQLYENYMATTLIYFLNCLQRLKQRCEFYNKPIRFHYSDIRHGVIGTDDKSNIIVKQIQEIHQLVFDENSKINKTQIQFIINLDKKLRENVIDIDHFFRLTKIDKQLAKLKKVSPQTVELLREYTRYHLEITRKIRSDEMMPSYLGEFEHIIGIKLSPLFDVYTLARMFYGNRKRVIIYAGVDHIERMRTFLVNKMGFRQTVAKQSTNRNSDFQCVSLKGVPQPWFQ